MPAKAGIQGQCRGTRPWTPDCETVRKLVRTTACRSGTARRAGPGNHEHLLCQCAGKACVHGFRARGLCPRPGMTFFPNFLSPSCAGVTIPFGNLRNVVPGAEYRTLASHLSLLVRARPYAGHPRRPATQVALGVDGRVKPGHERMTESSACVRALASAIILLIASAVASPAEAEELGFQSFAGRLSADVSANLQALRDDIVMSPSEAQQLGATLTAALNNGTGVQAVTFVLILAIVGAGLEWLYWTFAAAPLRAVIATTATTPRQAAVLALRRLALLGFGLLLFTSSTMAAAMMLPWPPNVEATVVAATAVVVAVRSAWIIADVIVSPHHPSLRMTAIQDYDPGFVVAGVAWLAVLTASAIVLPQLLATIGSAPHLAEAIRVGIGALIVISLIVAVSIAFRAGEESISGRKRPRFPRAFIACFIILATAMLALVGGGRIAAGLIDIAIVSAFLGASKQIVLFFWRDTAASSEEPGTEALPDMLPVIVLSAVRFAAVMIGIIGLIVIMRVPFSGLAAGSNPLAQLSVRVAETVALAFITHLGWIAIRFAIDRRLRRLAPLDPHGPPNENTRLLTLLPLLRTTMAIIFLVLFTLSALWTLGIQIAPLLAGAGIFGLAIGFGAQTLVRDIISGVFFLIEDVFRIGEYIESGTTTKGTVEHISLRTVALRHHNGPLTFVPYGLLGTVRNNSRDWVVDKFNLPLPLSVDSEKIRKMIKKIGEEMLLDPELGQLIREPLKGKLYRVDPGIKIFRCKFMTAPGCQFEIRSAAFKMIEAALADAEIAFAGAAPQTVLVRRAPDT
jgi:moderate conductance mechanosensitive channel